jgi:hypothetical protein
MLETHIVMSSSIFCLILTLVLHLTHLLVLCLISLMDLCSTSCYDVPNLHPNPLIKF